MARIVLNTLGSLGDLHPFLGMAIGLARRGHTAVIATSEIYRSKIEAEGVGFAPVRPDLGALLDDRELMRKIWDRRRGTEYLLKEVILPSLEDSFEDLMAASERADLLVTHTTASAGPVVAELTRTPWLSVALQPMVFFSAYDPPVLGPAQWLRHFYRFGQWPFKLAFQVARRQVKSWIKPILRLRRNVGLKTTENPIFRGQFSHDGTLALFSKHFASAQPDWPRKTTVTGFVYYERLGEAFGEDTGTGLEEFLANGEPPILFTLGSSAVMQAGSFFEESIGAAEKLGRRAVLLVGPQQQISRKVPPSIFLAEYAPYSAVMPRAAVTVHQGGIGTMAQALLAGRPMLTVPWAHDQPDNAERARKLGVSRTLDRRRYSAESAARELAVLLGESEYGEKAAELRGRLLTEDGLAAACDRIEGAVAG